MREIHLALARSGSPGLGHTCHSKNTPLLINQALGAMLTAHGISLGSFNDCIEIIKAESEYQTTQLKKRHQTGVELRRSPQKASGFSAGGGPLLG